MHSFLETKTGELLVRAPVEMIDTDEAGRVTGVSVKGVHVRAPMVISAAGVYTTFVRMMPKSEARVHASGGEKAQRTREASSGNGADGGGEGSGGGGGGRQGRVRRRSLSRFEFEVEEGAGGEGAGEGAGERVVPRRVREFDALRRSLFEDGKGASDKRGLPLSRTWVSLFVGFDVDNSVSLSLRLDVGIMIPRRINPLVRTRLACARGCARARA